ncbi:MAG: [protein-PII] uridylyltransferase [Verrucomicrobiales bacterium]
MIKGILKLPCVILAKNLKNLRSHAESAIRSAPEQVASHAELLGRYKRFLKTEEHRVKLQHRAGGCGIEICTARAELLDIVLQNLLEQALRKVGDGGEASTLTLVAVGGYGRKTLNPSSDVDLLFLHTRSSNSLPEQTRDVIESVLYMLWDVGFKVGHAVRSIRECIQQANSDSQTKTSMMDARFLIGDEALFNAFTERFWKSCIKGKEADYLESRRQDLTDRHSKYDRTVFLQEPQIKNGCGSLRDYHTLRWICFVQCEGSHDLSSLVDAQLLSEPAFRQTEKALDFLLRVRNEMHYAEKQATDILTLRLQGVVAKNLKYPQKKVLHRIEAFMRDYYMHTRNLFNFLASVMQRLDLRNQEESSGLVNFLARRRTQRESFDGFYSQNCLIYPESSDIFVEDSARMMRAFLHMQQRHLELSPSIRVLLKKNYALVNVHFRYRKKIRETFEAILSHKGDVGHTLRQMHRVDFLGRYLPEFGALTCLVQHEFFHRYTADEHTLKCIEMLDALSDTDERSLGFYQALFHNVEDPFILYLALIMHDTGRAENVRQHADASTILADRVARRLGISVERRRLLLFLVDHHLTFWKTATSRNIEDPNVVREFAQIMQNKTYLDILFVMTYADSKGTNKEAWSDWKEALMRQLYHSTIEFFADSNSLNALNEKPSDELRMEVEKSLDDDFANAVKEHFELMPLRYFRFRGVKPICRHIRLIKSVKEAEDAAENKGNPLRHRWTATPEQSCSQFVICLRDRPELLAAAAGSLAAQNLNILSADFFLRKDGIVVDMFRVCTVNFEPVTVESTQRAVSEMLESWSDGEPIDLKQRIADKRESSLNQRSNLSVTESAHEFPQRVYLTNEISPDYTVVEIQVIDRIGLLFDIFSTITALDLEIAHARINTEKGAAIDTLYLSKRSGGKITARTELAEIRHQLEIALSIP